MKLWMVLYVSQASMDITPTELRQLVAAAKHNNAQDGITGSLMYYRGRFMQVLEGQLDVVNACLERIAQDSRHHDMNVIHQGPIEVRRFGEWTMRSVATQHDNEPVVDDFWRRLSRSQEDGSPPAALGAAVLLMQRMAQRSPPAATI